MKTKTIQQEHAKYFSDLKKPINVNNGIMSLAIWNLILSIRDLKLYSKGIKPHRHWKITDVKKYFGVNGSTLNILSQLELELELQKQHIEEYKQKNNIQ